ncbi:release factor glutamine methyltransferase [Arthrobacter alpinus]|uniref:peptide chain release factor N(5)-glutamine methyltransferase n=2 Tax=Arthrobacter alpinus TaxID=656366 RepID=A0A0U3PTC3_9MICC|nr:putative protein N(5)-glutamine methyltransferase [Arthrobacter alpinus]ALV45656.1 hypothetical protein MB46_09300 [Arthrobacter alpinus]SEE06537.1 release factor glutamine methyltransferase [Arthrobacter alpinus]
MPAVELVAALRSAGCVFAEEEAAILLEAAGTAGILTDMLALRTHGHPLEHIVGWAQFYGLRIAVAPGVFVPRLRSEFLVSEALDALLRMPSNNAGLRILDLCCGSGAIGAALTHRLTHRGHKVELHAADIDPVALECAARNIGPFHGTVHSGDLFAALPHELGSSFHIIVANAPYVPTSAIDFMPQEARVYEPEAALDGGIDGLAVQRRIALEAPAWLRPDGLLLIESSVRQAPKSAAIMGSHGFSTSIATNHDVDGTVVTGRMQ